MFSRSTVAFLTGWLGVAAMLAPPARAQVHLLGVFAGNCAQAEGLLESGSGGYSIFACAGPIIGIGDYLPAQIVGTGIGYVVLANTLRNHTLRNVISAVERSSRVG